jgi:CheY-like chemotaxis protein
MNNYPFTNRTILCIDDDADDLQMLREAIASISHDYTIREAYDGLSGLATLQHMKAVNQLPCLIVMDINMPRMDGKQAFVKLQEDPILSNIPIVIFSTSSSPLDKMFFQHKGVEFMTKPIVFEQLVDTAEKLLSMCA